MNSITNSLDTLRARIAKIQIEDKMDLLYFIQLASRMKGLGDDTEFKRIAEIAAPFADQLEDILKERCERGIFDLEQQEGEGEELALSIIEAQDFWLFYQYGRGTGLFSEKVHIKFESWSEAVHLTEIDEETASILCRWLETYPIKEEYQLPKVHAPVTRFDMELLGLISSFIPCKEVRGTLKKAKRGIQKPAAVSFTPPALLLACDDDKPSDVLLRQQEDLYFESSKYKLKVTRFLNDRWRLVIDVTGLDSVESVCIGGIPAMKNVEKSGRWYLDLVHYPPIMRMHIITGAIVIQKDSTTRFRISFPENL